MNTATAQIIASQYIRGLLDGMSPNAASQASGHLSEYYTQGFDDGRNSDRKTVVERGCKALEERNADPQGIAFIKLIREAYSKIDADHGPTVVYGKLMAHAGQLIDEASQASISFAR